MRVDNDSHIYDHNFLNHTTMTMKDKLASYNHLIETFVIVTETFLCGLPEESAFPSDMETCA